MLALVFENIAYHAIIAMNEVVYPGSAFVFITFAALGDCFSPS